MKETVNIETYKLKLSSRKGFISVYYEQVNGHESNRAAYYHLEEVRAEVFGGYGFKSYNAFKTALYRNKKKSKK